LIICEVVLGGCELANYSLGITCADLLGKMGEYPGASSKSRSCRDVILFDSNTNVSILAGKCIVLAGFAR
jgi:hypothetical protein